MERILAYYHPKNLKTLKSMSSLFFIFETCFVQKFLMQLNQTPDKIYSSRVNIKSINFMTFENFGRYKRNEHMSILLEKQAHSPQQTIHSVLEFLHH